jgi:hypothetical protein
MVKSLSHAGFVFEGTVVRLKDATMNVPDRTKTVVVHIDSILRAPEMLLGHAGKDITLLPAKGERLKRGQRAVFHANGWLYGDSMAVQSVGHESVLKGAGGTQARDPVRAAADHAIAQHATQAPLVITGKVVAVGLPGTAAGSQTAKDLPAPISEHEPLWSEAVIAVQEVHKGALKQKQIVVRFPASHDVRWHRVPKFQVGQEGVFLLHPDEVTKLRTPGVAAAAHEVAPTAYTCLHAVDFQPADHPHGVAAALQAISSQE